MASKKSNHAEAAVVTFVETLGKIAQSNDRQQVRDAGAIAPLVALMVSGTGDVPGRVASVLRDLALHEVNRTAIIQADGIAQLVRMLSVDSKAIATEAADALRSLCANNVSVCTAIRSHHGIKALVQLITDGQETSAMQAVGALCNMAEADADCKREIGSSGGAQALVNILHAGFSSDPSVMRKRGGDGGNWAVSKSCEGTAQALHILVADPSCCNLVLEAGVIAPLVMTLLRAGHHSRAAAEAAAILVLVLKADRQKDGSALSETLRELTDQRRDDTHYAGHGWMREFNELRLLLHSATEVQLVSVETGLSSAAIQTAIEVGRAVEMPVQRLEQARANFEEAQAKRKREQMASRAEERRARKEEERAAAAAEAEAAEPILSAEEEEKKKRGSRKEAVPTRFVKRGTLLPGEREARAAQAADEQAAKGIQDQQLADFTMVRSLVLSVVPLVACLHAVHSLAVAPAHSTLTSPCYTSAAIP